MTPSPKPLALILMLSALINSPAPKKEVKAK